MGSETYIGHVYKEQILGNRAIALLATLSFLHDQDLREFDELHPRHLPDIKG